MADRSVHHKASTNSSNSMKSTCVCVSRVADDHVTRRDCLETLITKLWLLHESIPIKINVVTVLHNKRWWQCAIWKRNHYFEAIPKIGNINTDKNVLVYSFHFKLC